MARQFPASAVTITRVYLVDCSECGERVDDDNAGHGDSTRADAERSKAAHVAWHRAEHQEAR